MYTFTEDEIKTAIKESSSFLEAASKLKTSRQTITRKAKELGLSIDHFRRGRNRPYDLSQIFKKDSKVTRTCVKQAVLKHKLLTYVCICGLTNEWQGKHLVLELDHIDGDKFNNLLTNLRFLCANCHSQTETNKGKNKRGFKK